MDSLMSEYIFSGEIYWIWFKKPSFMSLFVDGGHFTDFSKKYPWYPFITTPTRIFARNYTPIQLGNESSEKWGNEGIYKITLVSI